MINCEIDVKSMRNALDIVIDVVTKKNKNLLYEYVELKVTEEQIVLSGTDSNSYVTVKLKGTVKSPGQIMFEPVMLLKLLKDLDSTKNITVSELQDQVLSVGIGTRLPYSIRGKKGTVATPVITGVEINNAGLDVLKKVKLIEGSIDKDKQYVTMKLNSGSISISATNGYRLAKYEKSNSVDQSVSVVIDSKIVNLLNKCEVRDIGIDSQNKMIRFSGDIAEVVTKQILDPVPDVDLIVNNFPEYSLKIETEDFVKALKRLEIFGLESVVKVEVKSDIISFTVDDVVHGNGFEESFTATNNNKPIIFHIKLSYFLDALNSMETAKIGYNSNVEPIFIVNSNLTQVIMPIRA